MDTSFASVLLDGPINGYQQNGQRKRLFHLRGMKFLRDVERQLRHPDSRIRWNKSGNATSGDLMLHTPSVYLHLDYTLNCCGGSVGYYRTVKSLQDYTGGTNHNLLPDDIKLGPAHVAQLLRDCRP